MSQSVVERPYEIASGFTGIVHLPGEAGYEEQRQPLFPTIDPKPAVVVEAFTAADVQAAVNTAREHGLPLSVQATGHGTWVPADGGVLLKTAGMATVLVDPDRRIAHVGPGARWSDVLAAAAPFGLAPLSGSHPGVGVTGYTLGGGLGWLGRKYGFAADSVIRAEVVTAAGHLVQASADQHPDLFWALRGGGGNFGVVTSLEFRLYPVAQVFAGIAYFPVENAAETLRSYRDWAAGAPDELSTAALLTQLPDTEDVPAPVRGRRVLAIKAMYAGEAAEARRLLQPLWAKAGPALWDGLRSMSYAEAAMGGTPARHLDLFDELPDAVIDVAAEAGRHATVEIRHWGGALSRTGPEVGSAGHRSTRFSVIVDQSDAEMAEALRPYANGGSFLNFLSDPAKAATAYTPENHWRLVQVKRAYDPMNLFRFNHNIAPVRG